MGLPSFRYHPDPIKSGSIIPSDDPCRCCGEARGFVYAASVYSEEDLDAALCPWCIADGSAHQKYGATFVDSEAFGVEVPDQAIAEISERTPGYSSWQSEEWPACCDDATAFIAPLGIAEIRAQYQELEAALMGHIVHAMGISGGTAQFHVDTP